MRIWSVRRQQNLGGIGRNDTLFLWVDCSKIWEKDRNGGKVSMVVPEAGEITIRKCQGIDELNACVALQKEVWNFADVDLVPL
ncbi:MAG TPA: hypothetical protein VFP71_03575, partial [Candidatus Angelobacter sp.]|nr:hypothetical protein [Candidatus Angelobacter sp.]